MSEEALDKVALNDYLLGIERHLLLIQALQKEMSYTARMNIGEENRKALQFLKIADNTTEDSFRHISRCIELIQNELNSSDKHCHTFEAKEVEE